VIGFLAIVNSIIDNFYFIRYW